MPWGSYELASKFESARHKELLAGLLDLLRRESHEILAFNDVRACLHVRGQRALGLQVVKVSDIVGSEGRYHDFDRQFRPRASVAEHRWTGIERAMITGQNLPAISLYKMGDVYFVRDGNHRVSVARQLGYSVLDADVTELLVDVPLSADLSLHTLLLKQEYSDFLEWTNLHDLRPDERIEFSELGGYLDLVREINRHRYALAQEQDRTIDRDEAVASWYDNVYLPFVQSARERRMLKRNSKRTEADLYRWMANQHAHRGDAPTEPARRQPLPIHHALG